MAERGTTDARVAERQQTEADVAEAAPGAPPPPMPTEATPTEPELRDRAAPDTMPEAEQPTPDQAPVAEGIEGNGATAYDTVPDLEGTDPLEIDPHLQDILNAEDTSGGLDGRNDADLDSAGPTDPGATPPMGGLEGAAGKVDPGVQAVLDKYDAEAKAAAAEGDFDKVDQIATRTHDFLVSEGIKPAPTETTTDTGEGTELLTNFGSLSGGKQQVWDTENDEVKLVDTTEDSGGTNFVSEATQMQQTGTAASGDGGEGTTPPTTTQSNEDHAEGSEGLPAHLNDPSDGIDEEHEQIQWESELGGDVDPHPEGDYADVTDAAFSAAEPETYTAEYEQDYVEPQMSDAPPESNIDWEFMEGG